jgi:uncharacterized protein YraI
VRSGLFAAIVMVAACACATGTARANNAYTQGHVHLRAGPSTDYPLVTSIAPNSLLQVNGCLDDFTWCDVDWEGNRGWVYGNYLYYDYQDRRVPVLQFGATLGIGIVAFSIGDYWGRYYSGRPWYGRRSYWEHRPPPPRRPRPPHRPGGRPPNAGGPPPSGGGAERPQRPGAGRPGQGGPRPGPGNPGQGGSRPSRDNSGQRPGPG